MRRFLISAAMMGLAAASSVAMAQDRDRGNEPRDQGRPPQASGAPQRPGPAMSGPPEHREAPSPNSMRGPGPNTPPGNAARGPAPNNAMRGQAPNPAANNAIRRPVPNNTARGPAPARDFSSVRNYHQNFNAARRFRAPAYRPPPGWYARQWVWGDVLPVAFWPRNYWLTNYAIYDLPPPPFGAIWVRVGSDALLIDQNSGEIIEVDYGVFY
jgi:Ni/Co efflux regulator RcnB